MGTTTLPPVPTTTSSSGGDPDGSEGSGSFGGTTVICNSCDKCNTGGGRGNGDLPFGTGLEETIEENYRQLMSRMDQYEKDRILRDKAMQKRMETMQASFESKFSALMKAVGGVASRVDKLQTSTDT